MDDDVLDSVIERLGRDAIAQIQLKKFQLMLKPVLESNAFYREKLNQAGVMRPEDITSLKDYRNIPLTTKAELSADQIAHPPYGTNLTFSLERYLRIHQTSGTKGQPLLWLDTEESWRWWARCWSAVYQAASVTSKDRIFFAFSFGPFIGFWAAHEGARRIGTLAIPGGGMSSIQRLNAIRTHHVSVLVCTPTYALHLAEVAAAEGMDTANSSVRVTIQAGEPGASLPAVKDRIQTAWGARCYDHAGATEVGAWGFECGAQAGLHINEGEFIVEVLDPTTGEPAEEGELVITNLGRAGMPAIRYRTGDRGTLDSAVCQCGRTLVRLAQGIVGRVDDALVVRGVNVYPSAIENIVRRFPEVAEFAVDLYRRHELDAMEIRMEVREADATAIADEVAKVIRNQFGLRVAVTSVPYGTLPRFDLKAKRFTDHR